MEEEIVGGMQLSETGIAVRGLQESHPDFAKIVDSVLKTAISTKRGSRS